MFDIICLVIILLKTNNFTGLPFFFTKSIPLPRDIDPDFRLHKKHLDILTQTFVLQS